LSSFVLPLGLYTDQPPPEVPSASKSAALGLQRRRPRIAAAFLTLSYGIPTTA
jgi:hypothetical protein